MDEFGMYCCTVYCGRELFRPVCGSNNLAVAQTGTWFVGQTPDEGKFSTVLVNEEMIYGVKNTGDCYVVMIAYAKQAAPTYFFIPAAHFCPSTLGMRWHLGSSWLTLRPVRRFLTSCVPDTGCAGDL